MSVSIAAVNGNGLTATTNLSNPQSFTKLIWAKYAGTPTTITNLVGAQNTGATSFALLTPAQFNSGSLSVQTGNGAGDDSFPSQPTWTNWNCYAITGTTAGAGSLIGYWQDNAGGSFKSRTVTGVSFTNSNDNIGKNTMAFATTVAFYKEWSTVLSPVQLQAEFLSATAVISAGLRRYLALVNAATAGTDTSGNTFNMTTTGVSDGVGSPTFPAISSGGGLLTLGVG